jgi:hypothetical protein
MHLNSLPQCAAAMHLPSGRNAQMRAHAICQKKHRKPRENSTRKNRPRRRGGRTRLDATGETRGGGPPKTHDEPRCCGVQLVNAGNTHDTRTRLVTYVRRRRAAPRGAQFRWGSAPALTRPTAVKFCGPPTGRRWNQSANAIRIFDRRNTPHTCFLPFTTQNVLRVSNLFNENSFT